MGHMATVQCVLQRQQFTDIVSASVRVQTLLMLLKSQPEEKPPNVLRFMGMLLYLLILKTEHIDIYVL